MKKTNILLASILASVLVLSSCGPKVEPLGITITSENNVVSVIEGDTLQLTATVHPEGVSSSVTWSSSNDDLATISNTGLVTTLNDGNVFLYATSTVKTSVRGEFALQITQDPNPDPQSINIVSSTGNNFVAIGLTLQLTHTVLPPGSDQNVTWATGDGDIATVSQTGLVTGVQVGSTNISATSVDFPSVSGQISITVTDVTPPEPTVEWDEVDFASHEDFMNAENDTPLKIKGKVWHVLPVEGSGHEATVSYYIQNGTEGFYVYRQNAFFFPVEVNKVYIVGGFKDYYYQGLHEIVGVEYFEEIDESINVTINDLSSINVMDNDVTAPYHASYVNIPSGTISSLPTSYASAYSVNVDVDGNVIAYRADPKVSGATEFAAITAVFQGMAVGSTLSAKGILTAFGYGSVKSNQLLIVKASDIEGQAMSDQMAVELASEVLVLENTIELDESTITLPTTVDGFDGVEVSWTSHNPEIFSGGPITRPVNDTDIVLEATFEKNSADFSKDYVITVLGSNQSNQTNAHLLDFEDAAEADSYGNSTSQPSYNHSASNNLATLGTPAATWHYGRTLISAIQNDRVNGTWSARMQSDKTTQANSGRLELREDFVFDFLEFNVATYGNDPLNAKLEISYSVDEGANWTALDRVFVVGERQFELCRIYVPTEGQSARVAISLLVDGTSYRVNFDDIRLARVGD